MEQADNVLDIEYERKQLLLRKASEFVVALRSSHDIDLEKTAEALATDLMRFSSKQSDDDRYFWNTNKLSDLAIAYVEERRKNKGLPGYHTGFVRLDNGVGGYERDNIYTLNSRSGMGKTTFLLQSAWELASQTTVIYFSPEARAKMLSRRLISLLAGVPGWQMRRGDVDDSQMKLIQFAAKKMRTRPIFFYDLPELSIRQMDMIMDRVYKETGEVAGACVLDYLQQMSGEDSFQIITNNMKSIETFTVTNNVAMLMASQVGRASGDGSAQDSAKGSGKIEELSSVVMGLTRVEKKGEESADPNDQYRRWVNISKNREEGDIFKFGVRFDRDSGELKEEDFGDE